MGEVSDVVDDDTTTVIDNDTSINDNETSNNDNETVDAVFFCATRNIMNWVRRKAGTAAREDRRFREHFGKPFTRGGIDKFFEKIKSQKIKFEAGISYI